MCRHLTTSLARPGRCAKHGVLLSALCALLLPAIVNGDDAEPGGWPALRLEAEQVEYEGRSLKSQMKRADRLKAPLVMMLGDDELARNEVSVKDMATSTQESIKREAAVEFALSRGSSHA